MGKRGGREGELFLFKLCINEEPMITEILTKLSNHPTASKATREIENFTESKKHTHIFGVKDLHHLRGGVKFAFKIHLYLIIYVCAQK